MLSMLDGRIYEIYDSHVYDMICIRRSYLDFIFTSPVLQQVIMFRQVRIICESSCYITAP